MALKRFEMLLPDGTTTAPVLIKVADLNFVAPVLDRLGFVSVYFSGDNNAVVLKAKLEDFETPPD